MRATTVREELIVALFDDAADLIKRLEALGPVMDDTQFGVAEAARELAARTKDFQAHMRGIAATEQYRAVHYVREQVEQTSRFWQEQQVALLKEAGRAILKEEVGTSLQQVLSSLERTSTRLKRREAVLMHVTNTVVSVAATVCVLAFLFPAGGIATPASVTPRASAESPSPATATSPPGRVRGGK